MTNETKFPVLSGAALNWLIAGPKGDSRSKEIRFVLTAESFRPLQGTISKQEIDDTIELVTELRRRINLFAQIQSLENRSALWQKISGEVDELYLAISLLGDTCPSGTIKELEKKRTLFDKIRRN